MQNILYVDDSKLAMMEKFGIMQWQILYSWFFTTAVLRTEMCH
jgi:hypothetical protein